LADFINYEKKLQNINYKSIFDVEIKNNKLEFVSENYEITKQFKWYDFLSNLKCEPDFDFIDYCKESGDRLDITKAISNSVLLFYIAIKFAKQLSSIDKNKLIFFTGSYEGKLLIDTTVFVYKTLYQKNEKEFYINGKCITKKEFNDNEEDFHTLFIDISIISGFTKERVFNIDLKNKINKNKNDFDTILTIISKNNYKDKEGYYALNYISDDK
jgi:hypothetical protein